MLGLNRYLSAVALLMLAAGSLFDVQASAQPLSVHVLDVGEGQAMLLHKNQHAILIDTGHAGMARRVIQRLRDLRITELDYLILTHLHPDHASGFFRIAEEFPQSQVLDSCHPIASNATPDMMRWVQKALRQHPSRQCIKAADSLEWQGTQVTILWPREQPRLGAALNHHSLVLQIEHTGRTVLVMGDADKAAELELLAAGKLKPVDLLVVGHHGSAYASSEEFLQRVQPDYAVISTNANNFRGYPSAATVARLERYSGKVIKTYEGGEFALQFE